jgi:hypothetical protein
VSNDEGLLIPKRSQGISWATPPTSSSASFCNSGKPYVLHLVGPFDEPLADLQQAIAQDNRKVSSG